MKMITVIRTFFNKETELLTNYGAVLEDTEENRKIILKERQRDKRLTKGRNLPNMDGFYPCGYEFRSISEEEYNNETQKDKYAENVAKRLRD